MYDVVYAVQLTEAVHWLNRMGADIHLDHEDDQNLITLTVAGITIYHRSSVFDLVGAVRLSQIQVAKALA